MLFLLHVLLLTVEVTLSESTLASSFIFLNCVIIDHFHHSFAKSMKYVIFLIKIIYCLYPLILQCPDLTKIDLNDVPIVLITFHSCPDPSPLCFHFHLTAKVYLIVTHKMRKLAHDDILFNFNAHLES